MPENHVDKDEDANTTNDAELGGRPKQERAKSSSPNKRMREQDVDDAHVEMEREEVEAREDETAESILVAELRQKAAEETEDQRRDRRAKKSVERMPGFGRMRRAFVPGFRSKTSVYCKLTVLMNACTGLGSTRVGSARTCPRLAGCSWISRYHWRRVDNWGLF